MTKNTMMAVFFAMTLLAGFAVYVGATELTDTGSADQEAQQSDGNETEVDNCDGSIEEEILNQTDERPLDRRLVQALETIRYLTENFTKDLNLTELSEIYDKVMEERQNRTATMTCPYCNATISFDMADHGMMRRHPHERHMRGGFFGPGSEGIDRCIQ